MIMKRITGELQDLRH